MDITQLLAQHLNRIEVRCICMFMIENHCCYRGILHVSFVLELHTEIQCLVMIALTVDSVSLPEEIKWVVKLLVLFGAIGLKDAP